MKGRNLSGTAVGMNAFPLVDAIWIRLIFILSPSYFVAAFIFKRADIHV